MCICLTCCNNKFICLLISIIFDFAISFSLYYFATVSKFDHFKIINECYEKVKGTEIYIYKKNSNEYSSKFEIFYEFYPKLEPNYNLVRNIILIVTFIITFFFVIRSCFKLPKNGEPNFKVYKGLIITIYIINFIILFGNFFYSLFLLFVVLQLPKIDESFKCTIDDDMSSLKNANFMIIMNFVGNIVLTVLFIVPVVYIYIILRLLNDNNLPCQNFILEYEYVNNEEFFSDKYYYLEDYNFGIINKVRIA